MPPTDLWLSNQLIKTIFVLAGEASRNFNFMSIRFLLRTVPDFSLRIRWIEHRNPVDTRQGHLSETEFLRVVSQLLQRRVTPPILFQNDWSQLSSVAGKICTNNFRSTWCSRCPSHSLLLLLPLLVFNTVVAAGEGCELVSRGSLQANKGWRLLLLSSLTGWLV